VDCEEEQVCNWNNTIHTEEECTASEESEFCGECDVACQKMDLNGSCYMWVESEQECEAIGGKPGSWGPWHCVLPYATEEECVPSKYCPHIPAAEAGLSAIIGFEKSCGGACIAVGVETKEECEQLNVMDNDEEAKRFKPGFDEEQCVQSMNHLSVAMATVRKRSHTNQRNKWSMYSMTEKEIAFLESRMCAETRIKNKAAKICSDGLQDRFLQSIQSGQTLNHLEDALNVPSTQQDETDVDSYQIDVYRDIYFQGKHPHHQHLPFAGYWNYYHWVDNMQNGQGYCQIANLWGSSNCSGDNIKWIPPTTFQRSHLNTEESCRIGICSTDARMNSTECSALPSCNVPCPKCKSAGWGASLCYDANNRTSEKCESEKGDYDPNTRLCVFSMIDDKSDCISRGYTYHSCEDLNVETCQICENGHEECPVLQRILKCAVDWKSNCENQQECEQSGRCDDEELTNPVGDGVCIEPFNTTKHGRAYCPESRRRTRMGCINDSLSTTDVCVANGGKWIRRAKTMGECMDHGTGCNEPKFWHPTLKTPKECDKCHGQSVPLYHWTGGKWERGHVKPLTWKTRQFEPANKLSPTGLNETLLKKSIDGSVKTMLSSKLQSRALCRYGHYASSLFAFSCSCGDFTDPTCSPADILSLVGQVNIIPGAQNVTLSAGDAVHVRGTVDTVFPIDPTRGKVFTYATDALTWVSTHFFDNVHPMHMHRDTAVQWTNNINREAKMPRGSHNKKKSSYIPNLPTGPYEIVFNGNGAIIGQILAVPALIDIAMAPMELCMIPDQTIPKDLKKYGVYDFAYASEDNGLNGQPGTFMPMNLSVTQDAITKEMCVVVQNELDGFFVPIARRSRYEYIEPCNPDGCGICGGDNSSCAGCDHVPYSGKTKDICGVCDGNGTSCAACCPGYTGKTCDVQDLCYGVKCKNDGLCDPLTGRCACLVGYTGEHCEVHACSGNGHYHDNACQCYYGWGGKDCSQCAVPESPGKTYLCIPPTEETLPYFLLPVPDHQVSAWLDGSLVAMIYPKAIFKYATFPNSADSTANVYRDCRCKAIMPTPESRKVDLAPQVIVTGKSPKRQQNNLRKGVHTNSALEATALYQSSQLARAQMDHYDQVRVTIEHWNNAVDTKKDLNEWLGKLAVARVRTVKDQSTRNKMDMIRMSTEKNLGEHPDTKIFGSNVIRAWHDEGKNYWVLRDNTAPFFEDTIDQCVTESSLTTSEMDQFTTFYENCIEVYQYTNGRLLRCLDDLGDIEDDENEVTCNGLSIAFWPVLAVAIILFIAVVVLSVCFFCRPYKVQYVRMPTTA